MHEVSAAWSEGRPLSSEVQMLLVIMSNSVRLQQGLRNSAHTARSIGHPQLSLRACGPKTSYMFCLAYIESDTANIRGAQYITIVRPRQYLSARGLQGPGNCCNFSDRQRTPRQQMNDPDTPSWRNEGTTFFCDPHRARTLRAQYRFLPALAHIRRTFLAPLRAKTLRWVVMVDDDSMVNAALLKQKLMHLDPSRPIYAGDMVQWNGQRPSWDFFGHFSTSGFFACGGSGAVISRQAVVQTDFGRCARRLHRGCYQSDWMIGQCVAEAGVMPVYNLSCGLCSNFCGHQMRDHIDTVVKSVRRGCAFAQLEKRVLDGCSMRDLASVPISNLCELAPPSLAVTHGFQNMTCATLAEAKAAEASWNTMIDVASRRFWTPQRSVLAKRAALHMVLRIFVPTANQMTGSSIADQQHAEELSAMLGLSTYDSNKAMQSAPTLVGASKEDEMHLSQDESCPAMPDANNSTILIRRILPTWLHVKLRLPYDAASLRELSQNDKAAITEHAAAHRNHFASKTGESIDPEEIDRTSIGDSVRGLLGLLTQKVWSGQHANPSTNAFRSDESVLWLQKLTTFVVFRDRVIARKIIALRRADLQSQNPSPPMRGDTPDERPPPPPALPPRGAGVGSREGKKHTDTVLARMTKEIYHRSCDVSPSPGRVIHSLSIPDANSRRGRTTTETDVQRLRHARLPRIKIFDDHLIASMLLMVPDINDVNSSFVQTDDGGLIKMLSKYLKALEDFRTMSKTAKGRDMSMLSFHRSQVTWLQRKLLMLIVGVYAI